MSPGQPAAPPLGPPARTDDGTRVAAPSLGSNMRGSPTEEFVDAGVVFDVRAFCPQLKDTSRDALKDVDEVTLVNLDTGREATHELGRTAAQARKTTVPPVEALFLPGFRM